VNIPAHLRDLNPHIAPKTLKGARIRKDELPTAPEVPGLKSELEAELYRQIKAAGLPLPILQVTLAKCLGRGWQYDGAWVEERIAYEVNGATFVVGGHSTGTGIHRDYEKWNAAVLLDWKLFVFDSKMIKAPKDGSDSQAIETLRKAFEWVNTKEMEL
jgi:hypothetical protein